MAPKKKKPQSSSSKGKASSSTTGPKLQISAENLFFFSNGFLGSASACVVDGGSFGGPRSIRRLLWLGYGGCSELEDEEEWVLFGETPAEGCSLIDEDGCDGCRVDGGSGDGCFRRVQWLGAATGCLED